MTGPNGSLPVSDEQQLASMGYKQELRRKLGVWTDFALGFAFVSPVVGLYSILGAGMFANGPAWVWALLIALTGQILLALVFAELASQYPISGGIYQWSRRLVGARYGWFAGWMYAWTQIITLASVCYFSGFWAAELFGRRPDATEQVVWSIGVLMLVTTVGLLGQNPLKHAVNLGFLAELVASVALGLLLLLFFARNDWSVFFHTLGAQNNWDGSATSGFLAAIAVAGWAFIGFDACSAVSEEVRAPTRQVPRALLLSLIVVGLVIVMNAVATVRAQPDAAGLVRTLTTDPLTPMVRESFGDWVSKPFQAVVVTSFLACALAIQTTATRVLYSLGRDSALPLSGQLRKVTSRQVPRNAVITSTVLGSAILCIGINESAAGTLIAFTSGGYYMTFLLAAGAALYARMRGRWNPDLGAFRLGLWGVIANALALAWVSFETVNIAWRRPELLSPGALWYRQWAVPLIGAVLIVGGVTYMAWKKPHTRGRAMR
ncbi:amino acid permease [Streptomyces sp. bgisy027]|uniref:amino acid permease n=1 Tax=Streptomyces sp. bgisy027 TaxID=3413770 RepID=UPI003D727970